MPYFYFFYEDSNMLKLNDKSKLKYFIRKYNINNLFTTNIEEYMDLYFFKKGSHICEKGDILDKFYFFLDGRAKVYMYTPNGKSLLIRFYSPLQIICDIEITSDDDTNYSIQAIEDSLCIAIPAYLIKNLCFTDIKF